MDSVQTCQPGQVPTVVDQLYDSRQLRQSKRLSLNFPILVPIATTQTEDPAVGDHATSHPVYSDYTSSSQFSRSPIHTHNMSAPNTSTISMPLTPPSESSEDIVPYQNNCHASLAMRPSMRSKHGRSHSTAPLQRHLGSSSPPDFLTLLASQERKVLELKEELARAEKELSDLKQSWALHEAGKKKTEFRTGVVKMSPIVSSTTASLSAHEHNTVAAGTVGLGVEVNEEHSTEERRRDLAREKLFRKGGTEEMNRSPSIKKSNQRIFSGSRHTRALSLLSTSALNSVDGLSAMVSNKAPANAVNPAETSAKAQLGSHSSLSSKGKESSDVINVLPTAPFLTRTNSGMSRDALNFGKTYKELASAAATSRRQLPQGLAPDQMLKQGKIVVDGVRDGLWNFFEDIRQATVGEEATVESNATQRAGVVQKKGQNPAKSHLQEPASFWREFGVDSPRTEKIKTKPTNGAEHVCVKHSHGRKQRSQPKDRSLDSENRTSRTHIVDVVPEGLSELKLDDHQHGSKVSTGLTTSDNPPSLLDDSPPGDVDDWEWGGFESPLSARFRASVGTDVVEAQNRQPQIKEVKWHELTS